MKLRLPLRAAYLGAPRFALVLRLAAWFMLLCCACPFVLSCAVERPCEGPRDCALGSLCVQGACLPACAKSQDCPTGRVCVEGLCQLCADDSSCDFGYTCRGGSCICEAPRQLCGQSCVDLQSDPKHCGKCSIPCQEGKICSQGQCLFCPANAPTRCAESCANLLSSSEHCGSCGHRLTGGQLCVAGKPRCPPGTQWCGSSCVNTRASAQHCGACGKACAPLQRCALGECIDQAKTCEETAHVTVLCNKTICVDANNDPSHCGKCNASCRADQLCIEGKCSCPKGLRECENRCVDTASHWSHCGGCGKACQAGQRCYQGQCVASCPKDSPTTCFGGCYNLKQSRQHCGACGHRCLGLRSCIGGRCQCPPGWIECDGDCVDPNADWSHCGGCNLQCPNGWKCGEGDCRKSCPDQTPSACQNGCFDLKSNPHHCGTCATLCRGGTYCYRGSCTCPLGEDQCQGVCVDLKTHFSHCGACGKVCKQGEVCAEGSCQLKCPKATPAICSGGCHDLQQSAQHCGACGIRCVGGQSCVQGQCQCPKGTLFCRNKCVDPTSTRLHCKACNSACKHKQICQDSTCQCSFGTQLCPGLGICVDFATDPSHCGGCQKACPQGTLCKKGRCGCPDGFEYCEGSAGVRCVDLQADASHCGACGMQCSASQLCVKGACTCPPGGALCKEATGEVCVDLKTSTRHCGTCGTACGPKQRCQGGLCCGLGSLVCGGACVDPLLDSSHCGACGNACKAGQSCISGACAVPAQCSVHGDCTQGSQLCVAGQCLLKPCKNHDQCPFKMGCLQGKCGGCKGDASCSTNQLCVNGACEGQATYFAGICNDRFLAPTNGSTPIPAAQARLSGVTSIAFHPTTGDIYLGFGFASSTNLPIGGCIGKLTQASGGSWSFSVLAGKCNDSTSPIARANALQFTSSGDLIILDAPNQCLQKMDSSGKLSPFAGACKTRGYKDGTGTAALFEFPSGLDEPLLQDKNGDLFLVSISYAQQGSQLLPKGHLRKITPTGVATTLAMNIPVGAKRLLVGFGSAGLLYFNDMPFLASDPSCIQRYDLAKKTAERYAGSCTASLGGADGHRLNQARLHLLLMFDFNSQGHLYFLDQTYSSLQYALRKIEGDQVTTLTPRTRSYRNGALSQSHFSEPRAMGFAPDGSLLIAANGCLRKIAFK